MMLRLLFEEDEVGRRAIAARKDLVRDEVGGRRLGPDRGRTAGRAAGHAAFDSRRGRRELGRGCSPRCFARWRSEDAEFQLADIDDAAATAAAARLEDAAAVADALAWRPVGALRARARRSAREESIGAHLVLVRHDLLGLSTVDGSGDVLAGWRGVVRTVLPRADVAFCRGALDVADELLDGHAEQTLYYGGSPRLTLQLGAALQGAVESRETGLPHLRVGRPVARRGGAAADAAAAL